MSVTISRDGAVPAYQQIADDLRAGIAQGRYSVGDRLPVERELARRYGVTAMTVRHGIAVLRAEGLIESHSKRGHFIARIPRDSPGQGPSANFAAVMTELQAVRDELHQMRQRLDQIEGRTAPADRGQA